MSDPAFKLYIYGAAFGLPSIDPDCLATICYCKTVLPPSSWTAIPCDDPTRLASRDLPLLVHNDTTIHGFDSITRYLARHARDPSDSLLPTSRATASALQAHIHTHALPLLDAHLYTTDENFNQATRPSLNEVLSPLARFTLPQRRLDAARRRTAPAGLSQSVLLDDKDLKDAQEDRDLAAVSSTAPSLLFRRHRLGVQAALRQKHFDTAFRVEAILEDLCEPLEACLAESGGEGLVKDTSLNGIVTKVDCLLFGYLALILYSLVPADGIAVALTHKHAAVVEYVDTLANVFARWEVDPDSVGGGPQLGAYKDLPYKRFSRHHIPYASAAKQTWPSALQHTGYTLLTQLTGSLISQRQRYVIALDPKSTVILGVAGSVVACVVASVSLAFSRYWPATTGDMVFSTRKAAGGLAGFGAVGAMLSSL